MSPIISGIVVGIGTMITTIIAGLSSAMAVAGGAGGAGAEALEGLGGLSGLTDLFPLDKLVPPFFFQIVVGIYLVEIIIILSILANGIESGIDKLNEEYTLAKNLNKSVIFYLVVSLITIIAFNMLAASVATKAVGA